jgi:hypothetical protein
MRCVIAPDQAVHCHTLGPKLGASPLTWHLACLDCETVSAALQPLSVMHHILHTVQLVMHHSSIPLNC